jgi:hypothetical protein
VVRRAVLRAVRLAAGMLFSPFLIFLDIYQQDDHNGFIIASALLFFG